MKTNDLPELEGPGLAAPSASLLTWPHALVFTAIALLAVVTIYSDAVVSMIATWNRGETYTHGYAIFPISAWLIWRRRDVLRSLTPQPLPAGLLVIAALSACWLVGRLASIQTLQEFALVASIPTVILTVLGARVASAIAFPLAFMLFAWPFGEFMVPPMIDWTADFTVGALRASGIPVYREANDLMIPSGRWSVVDACSGIRYLIASVCVGTVYAYLTYRSTTRRLAFIALAIAVPIVANWLRAYMIVMLGHLSGNRIAVGVDHLIYGWVFFGLVMLLLFAIGGRWREDTSASAAVRSEPRITTPAAPHAVGLAAALSIAAVAIGPAAAYALEQRSALRPDAVALAMPAAAGSWQSAPGRIADWTPAFKGGAATLSQTYSHDGHRVALYIAYYRNQRQGSELINFRNVLVSEYARWKITGRRVVTTDRLTGLEHDLRLGDARLVAWQWYWIGGDRTTSPLMAKLLLARSKLFHGADDSAVVIVYARDDRDPAAAGARVESFVRQALPAIEATLSDAASR